MWIFGYGSLIWKPGFQWQERKIGVLRGWQRRFYQGSYDHRGVPGDPGRVVTLLPDAQSHTWGAAFRIEGSESQRVLAKLDHREKGGYERHEVPIFGDIQHGEPIIEKALIYVATEGNPHYLGPAPVEEIARQVAKAQGPSGTNRDYVLNLADALRQFDVADEHVFAVAQAVGALDARRGGGC